MSVMSLSVDMDIGINMGIGMEKLVGTRGSASGTARRLSNRITILNPTGLRPLLRDAHDPLLIYELHMYCAILLYYYE